jgi:hypothetical protein
MRQVTLAKGLFDRLAVVLDACTMFPRLVRDVLLTLAAHGFFSPKWSARIRDRWTRSLVAQPSERVDDAVPRLQRKSHSRSCCLLFPAREVQIHVGTPLRWGIKGFGALMHDHVLRPRARAARPRS